MIDMNTITDTLVALVGAFGGLSPIIIKGFQYLKKLGIDKDYEIIKKYAADAIDFAAQKGINVGLDDAKMYNVALTWLQGELSKHGYKYTPDQLEGFIESTYKTLSKDWVDSNTTPVVSVDSNSDKTDVTPISDNTNVVTPVSNTVVNNTLTVPEEMMKQIYDQVLAKATADAEKAVKEVIENVQKVVTPVEQPVNNVPAQ